MSDIEILQETISKDGWLMVDDRFQDHIELAEKLLANVDFDFQWGLEPEIRIMGRLEGGVRSGRCFVP